ncbi:hypothetical protein B0H19DRAFT_159544 [Mycena capillaripes]|nr:hypothetical protein B0H19DRAFT_159544 [Mycena capillaripes]
MHGSCAWGTTCLEQVSVADQSSAILPTLTISWPCAVALAVAARSTASKRTAVRFPALARCSWMGLEEVEGSDAHPPRSGSSSSWSASAVGKGDGGSGSGRGGLGKMLIVLVAKNVCALRRRRRDTRWTFLPCLPTRSCLSFLASAQPALRIRIRTRVPRVVLRSPLPSPPWRKYTCVDCAALPPLAHAVTPRAPSVWRARGMSPLGSCWPTWLGVSAEECACTARMWIRRKRARNGWREERERSESVPAAIAIPSFLHARWSALVLRLLWFCFSGAKESARQGREDGTPKNDLSVASFTLGAVLEARTLAPDRLRPPRRPPCRSTVPWRLGA